jgi:hypothetical protein
MGKKKLERRRERETGNVGKDGSKVRRKGEMTRMSREKG